MGTGPLTIRPRSGTRALRKHASLRLEDGTIIAMDRRGRSRTFSLTGAENSPACAGSALAESGDYWLEDRNGRALLVLNSADWDGDELFNFKQALGLELNIRGPGERPPPKRPDVFRVMDPPYLSWGIRASAVGGAVIALRWLHIAPEFLVLWVAVPSLVLTIWFLFMHQRSAPTHEQILEDLRELDEDLIAAGDEPLGTGEEPRRRRKRTRKRR